MGATPWNWRHKSKRTKASNRNQGRVNLPFFFCVCRWFASSDAGCGVSALEETGQAPSLHKGELVWLAEEEDFRIPGNHRARDEHYDNHDHKFHVAPTTQQPGHSLLRPA